MSLCAEQSALEKRASDCTVPRGACISRDDAGVSINGYSSCTIRDAGLHPCSRSRGTASQRSRSSWSGNRTTAMTYRTYSGPRGSQAIAPLEKDRLLYKEFDTLDGALGWARHVNDGGRVALLIEGDDGTHLGKQEIAGALHHREAPPR